MVTRIPFSTTECNDVIRLSTEQIVNVFTPCSQPKYLKVLEKCPKNLIGHSRLAFNNHESNIDC